MHYFFAIHNINEFLFVPQSESCQMSGYLQNDTKKWKGNKHLLTGTNNYNIMSYIYLLLELFNTYAANI